MKIVYQGVDYTQRTAQRGAAPLHLIEMQAQSKQAKVRELVGELLTLGVLHRWSKEAGAYGAAVRRWQRDVKAGAAGPEDEPQVPDCALWLGVVNLFLTLRAGGWEGTLLDAASIPESEVRYVREVLDGADVEDDEDSDEDADAGAPVDPSEPASPDGPGTRDVGASPVGSQAPSEPVGDLT